MPGRPVSPRTADSGPAKGAPVARISGLPALTSRLRCIGGGRRRVLGLSQVDDDDPSEEHLMFGYKGTFGERAEQAMSRAMATRSNGQDRRGSR